MATRKQMKVGRVVQWAARGRAAGAIKEGKVVEIVPAGEYPQDRKGFRQTAQYTRPIDSYLVEVDKKFYWPEPEKLSIIA